MGSPVAKYLKAWGPGVINVLSDGKVFYVTVVVCLLIAFSWGTNDKCVTNVLL